ncbi:MAG: putative metallopeptidase [Candidatus Micrarchaeia archaeon]
MPSIRYEKAPDVERMLYSVMEKYRDEFPHINEFRVLCVRSYNSSAHAYARIWSMPQAWKTALDIDTFYVLEVLHENFDHLPEHEKEKTLLHELLHIPRTFSGALLPHVYGKGQKHIEEKVRRIFK